MRLALLLAIAVLCCSTPARAESELEKGFVGALRGCEEWVLNPNSWADGVKPFMSAVGLGDKMGPVDHVDAVALPPPALRRANHYWRINSTSNAGYILVVSDQLPMCHITGGGGVDLQPIIETVLNSSAFKSRWEKVSGVTNGDMETTVFRNRAEPKFSVGISRANKPDQRLDRVQVLATALFDLGK